MLIFNKPIINTIKGKVKGMKNIMSKNDGNKILSYYSKLSFFQKIT